jgi:hypothetical protein
VLSRVDVVLGIPLLLGAIVFAKALSRRTWESAGVASNIGPRRHG